MPTTQQRAAVARGKRKPTAEAPLAQNPTDTPRGVAHPVHVHRNGSRPAAARQDRRKLRTHTRRRPNLAALVGAYRMMVALFDHAGVNGRRLPRLRVGREQFIADVATWTYAGLVTFIPPRTDGARALLMATIPDLVFARIDRIAPHELLERLDPIVLDRWRATAQQLAMDSRRTITLTIDEAYAIAQWRLRAELPYHCPLRDFFTGGRLIR